jgi:HK97 gp10 family phage protein
MSDDLILFSVKGEKELVAWVKGVEKALLETAPVALEAAAEIPMQMMRRLVPTRTGKLKQSIRFTLGKRGGLPRTTKRTGSRGFGKTRVVGYILAGNQSTLVQGRRFSTRSASGKKRSRSHHAGGLWQNAILQEFGTTSMKAHPFFFVSYRATRNRMKQAIGKELSKAFKKAKGSGPPTTTQKAA